MSATARTQKAKALNTTPATSWRDDERAPRRARPKAGAARCRDDCRAREARRRGRACEAGRRALPGGPTCSWIRSGAKGVPVAPPGPRPRTRRTRAVLPRPTTRAADRLERLLARMVERAGWAVSTPSHIRSPPGRREAHRAGGPGRREADSAAAIHQLRRRMRRTPRRRARRKSLRRSP